MISHESLSKLATRSSREQNWDQPRKIIFQIKKRMWIKEHEFARVKLADQKYKSKRKFPFRQPENFATKFSGTKFSGAKFTGTKFASKKFSSNLSKFLFWLNFNHWIVGILIKIFCEQKLKTIKITRNISPKWFWNWEEESWRRKCHWRCKTNSDWRRNKRIWRSSSSYQIKVFWDLGHVTHVTRF